MAKGKNRTKAKQKLSSNTGILALSYGGAAVISAIIGFVLYQKLTLDASEASLNQAAIALAQQQVQLVEEHIGEINQSLNRLEQDSVIARLLQTQLDNPSEDLSKKLADAASKRTDKLSAAMIRLYPKDRAQLKRSERFATGYAELDQIKRASDGQRPQPEAKRYEQSWYVNVARPIYNDKTIVGVALVSFDTKTLTQRLSDQSHLGLSRIKQNFGHNQYLASSGSGNAGTMHSAPITQSPWTLEFTPSETLKEQTAKSPLIPAGITLVILALLCVAARFVARTIIEHNKEQSKLEEGERLSKRATLKKAVRKATGSPKKGDMVNPMYQDHDILDVNVVEEDHKLLGLEAEQAKNSRSQVEPAQGSIAENKVPSVIFRSYDIRGLAHEQITPELAGLIGQALGSEVLDNGNDHLLVARDGRNSSPELCQALIDGALSTGINVINIGLCPSPLLYFSCCEHEKTSSGVIVTASHNPGEYNGFKMVVNGQALTDNAIMNLRSRILRSNFHQGEGQFSEQDMAPEYIDRILGDVALAGDIHLVIDAGNGATSELAPLLFEELGCEVTPLYCEIDGDFPNHQPDPSREENLQDLINKVKEVGADLGVAFDGDGDRLTLVTAKGKIIWPDQILMLFAKDIVASNPGADVIFDVKSTRMLNDVITSHGGRPIIWKTGHSHMKAKMQETGALLGGEFSGHIFIKHRWYGFDDGLYACARLLEIITLRDQDLDTIYSSFPEQIATPEILIPIAEEKKFTIIDKLCASGEFDQGQITTIDGIRVEYATGWGLVRASNTSAALTLRFEAESEEDLQFIREIFKRELGKVSSDLAEHL